MRNRVAGSFEFWVSLALFIFSAGYGVGAVQLPLPQGSDQIPLNPRSIPTILSLLGVLLSGIIIVQAVRKAPSNTHTAETARRKTPFSQWVAAHRSLVTVVLLLFAMILYGILLPWLGFLLSSFLFIAASIYILNQRKWYIFLGVPLATVCIFWFLLEVLLGVYLGEGELYFMILEWIQGDIYQ